MPSVAAAAKLLARHSFLSVGQGQGLGLTQDLEAWLSIPLNGESLKVTAAWEKGPQSEHIR